MKIHIETNLTRSHNIIFSLIYLQDNTDKQVKETKGVTQSPLIFPQLPLSFVPTNKTKCLLPRLVSSGLALLHKRRERETLMTEDCYFTNTFHVVAGEDLFD